MPTLAPAPGAAYDEKFRYTFVDDSEPYFAVERLIMSDDRKLSKSEPGHKYGFHKAFPVKMLSSFAESLSASYRPAVSWSSVLGAPKRKTSLHGL